MNQIYELFYNSSNGLLIFCKLFCDTCVYISVVFELLRPSVDIPMIPTQ
jgi:hypothetical protein